MSFLISVTQLTPKLGASTELCKSILWMLPKNLKDSIIDLKELTSDILNRFIERIEIKPDGTPKIHYRFSESSVYFSDSF